MFQFFMNRRFLIIALILLLVTWVIFVTSHQRASEGKVEYFLNTAMVPLESIFNYLGQTAGDSWKTIAKLAQLKQENDRIQAEINDLKARQLGLNALKAENERLRESIQFQTSQPYELISVEIIAVNPSNWNSTVIINKGLNFGLKKNMAVIAPQGVVGRVGETRANTAEVILVTDPREGNFIGGIVERTRDIVFINGGGNQGECVVQPAVDSYFKDIKKNDLIVTSETSEIFPRGFPIGRIVSFKQKLNHLVTKASLKPVVNLSRLQILYVLKDNKDIEPKFSEKKKKQPEVNNTMESENTLSGGSDNAPVNP